MSKQPLGKGSLTLLEKLKKEYGPKFKATAPKSRHKITQACADLLCPHLIKRIGVGPGKLWRVKGEWCTEKRCPRDRKENND